MMKRSMFAMMVLLILAAGQISAQAAPCVEATLEFSGPQNDDGCYVVAKGGEISVEACVTNCSTQREKVTVILFASRRPFDICQRIGRPIPIAATVVRLAPGEQKCLSQVIPIPDQFPSTTIYYQLRAATWTRVRAVDCSEVECVQIVDP